MADGPLDRLVAPRATPDFHARLEAFIAERERARARWWQRVAVAAVVVAVAAATAASVVAFGGASASSMDETLSCGAIPVIGGVNEVAIGASTNGVSRFGGAAHPYPGGLGVSIGVQLHEIVGVSGSQSGPTVDSVFCTRARSLTVGRKGLALDGRYRTGDIPNGPDKLCFTATRITVRLHAVFAHGRTTSAELYVTSGARHRPVALIDWTPTKLTAYLSASCHDRV